MKNLAALFLLLTAACAQDRPASWTGVLRDASGVPLASAPVELRSGSRTVKARTGAGGEFSFSDLAPGRYTVAVETPGGTVVLPGPVEIAAGTQRTDPIRLEKPAEATGGEQLSSRQVSALPLNKRDFSQLLLLAAGTQTDANGAANFTQQFTINGQRGTSTVFAMDGIDTTDPEMGGATFSNFNVDAIEEIKSESGVMAAEIGHGAAGFTNVVSKSGTNDLHGSVFEFVRNAAFDARNFFDRRSVAQPGRIPPFNRNEFGVTNGGPILRSRTFYFVQYQGFRQVLGTTQVLPVPTADERLGRDTTAFPGDTLYVPVDPRIAPVLSGYPLPNDSQGPYGARTYATSSKVRTVSDQFSVRLDHRISDKSQLFARFNLNDVDGPLTNPSQTAIDPSFAIPFFDRQRNFGLTYTRTPSAGLTWETSLGFIRSTPNFPTLNRTQPALTFSDGLYEAFNAPAGSIMGAFGNLYQFRQNVSLVRGRHTWKAGIEIRINRDTTVFGTSPNGTYTFGGGAAYSPVEIRSQSGLHDIHRGDLLPDSLTGFLTATPFSYTITAAPPLFAQGERMGDSAVHRESYGGYIQDNWRISPRVSVNYGLRYELNTPVTEGKNRTSGFFAGRFLINPQPTYRQDWNGFSPRIAVDWRWNDKTTFHAAAAITTSLTNLWQDNFVTGGLPYVTAPLLTAAPGAPLPFSSTVMPLAVPAAYTTSGELIFASGRSTDVPPNTEMDVMRFARDLAALSPDKQVRPLTGQAVSRDFKNGYSATYTAGLERTVSDMKLSANYVATVGVALVGIDSPNGYAGATGRFAPYASLGYGPILVMTNRSHSSYHSLQTSAEKKSRRAGLGFQASYTFSKSLDDSSSVLGGFLAGASGTVLQTAPQNPFDIRSDKGPSTFDVTHAFALSVIQELPVARIAPGFGKRFTGGWQLLAMSALASGSPFTVYSGVQQTDAGSTGADRPDQIGRPVLSTSRAVREDYFGLGAANGSLFAIPADRRFGSLGRNTFRGPALHNFDFSLIKDTPIGGRGNPERAVMQFRAEVFNAFNIVNLGLPANIVRGPGFGVISRTAGPSRQIQLSLKLLY